MTFDLLHRIFEAQVDSKPQALAVVLGSQTASYGELESRANQIAHYLRRKGVGAGDLVAMLLPRGVDAYASLLGILKSGAAYVPIDKDYPDDRVEYILANSGSKALVTISEFGARVREFSGSVVCLDALEDALAKQSTSRVDHCERPITKNDPCYVIYTSGSTGKPKGVLIEHRNATHLVAAEAQIYGVHSSDRVYQGASLCFDLSVEEIWLAFNSGGTLVAATPEVSHGGPDLSKYLKEHKVTVLSCVPTLLRTFSDDLSALRLLIFGGEKCPDAIVSQWSREGRRLVNTYGPTEATVIATYADLSPGVLVTIGKAIPGYQVYLLDDDLREVAHGEVGEICVAGEGVARGYVGLPDATAKVFVQDPWGELGSKLYRTGDLGRFDAKNDIEFMGRKDSQVKIRGFRVELSEIETGLQEIVGIRFAACVLQENQSGAQKLIAYVQKELDRGLKDAQILAQLREKLPAYMVPSQIETLQEMPFLPSGKIDRKALSFWTKTTAATHANVDIAAQDLPQTKTEKTISGIWQEIFQIGVFSRNDDFFLDLGGHSLLGAQFVSELRKNPEFASASLVDLYDHPSVARLSAVLDAREHRTVTSTSDRDLKAEQRRHFWAGFAQLPLLPIIYSFQAMQWVSPYLVFYYLIEHEVSVLAAIGWSVLEFIALFPTLLLFNITMKWLLLGRIQAGRHKLWGAYYLRWWFVQRLMASINLNYLHGTPLLCFYYRLLGAKVGKDVYLGSNNIKAFDLVEIGNNTSIDEDASIYGATVHDGELIIGPISIGSNCFVGTWSTLKEFTVMEDGSRLEDLSLLLQEGRVPKNETWAGSPAAKAAVQETHRAGPPVRSLGFRIASIMIYTALVLLLPLISYLPLAPALALFIYIDPLQNLWLFLAALPFIGACFVLLLTSEVVAIKWLLLGRAKAGVYPVHGSFYVRHWVVERLLALSLEVVAPLHATVYLATWYRALGAKLGRFVELSTATSITPDLLEIGDGGTVADEASLGAARVENGWMYLAATKIGKRAFVGNTAVVPAGISLGEGALIGVLSLAPSKVEDAAIEDATWLGSPPRLLPKRQSSKAHGDARTYEPSMKLRFARAFAEIFRVTLPPAGFMLVTSLVVIAWTEGEARFGLATTLFALPIVYMICVGCIALTGVLAKWVLIGKYKPFERPLWSNFIWRLEFVNALFEFLTAPIALDALQGTPFLAWYFRLMGARVGRCLYAESMGVLEFDLTSVGDFVALNEVAVLQTHLFEDRVLKASYVRVSDRCNIGNAAVVLYDSVMQEGSTLEALSLLMKGEVLTKGAHFVGLPARSADQARRTTHDAVEPIRAPLQAVGTLA